MARPIPSTPFPPPVPNRARAARGDLIWPLLLGLAVGVAYANSLWGVFLFDDIPAILNNPTIRDLTDLRTVFTRATNATVVGRPLLNFSLAVNWAISGDRPWSYHVLNIVFHVLAVLALYGLVRATLQLPSIPERLRSRSRRLAFASALLWGLHPLTTLAVTYVVQRAECMAAICYLLALRGLIAAAARPSAAIIVATSAVAWVGILTKETVSTLPLVALAFDRIFLAPSWNDVLRKRWTVHLGLLSTWPILLVLMSTNGGREGTAGFGYGISPLDYARTQLWAIPRYLKVSLWPVDVVFDHGAAIVTHLSEIWPSAVVLAVVLAGSALLLWARPRLGFLPLAFFVILGPTSSIVPLVTQTIAEHRVFLSLAALVVLVVLSVEWVCDRLPRAVGGPLRVCLLVAAALGLATLTVHMNFLFQSPERLWSTMAVRKPLNPRVYTNWGVALASENRRTEARDVWLRGLKLIDEGRVDPEQQFTQEQATLMSANIAGSWILDEQPEKALAVSEASLKRWPADFHIHYNRSRALLRLNRPQDALEGVNRSLTVEPSSAAALDVKIQALVALGHLDEAMSVVDQYHATKAVPSDELRGALLRLKSALDARATPPR